MKFLEKEFGMEFNGTMKKLWIIWKEARKDLVEATNKNLKKLRIESEVIGKELEIHKFLYNLPFFSVPSSFFTVFSYFHPGWFHMFVLVFSNSLFNIFLNSILIRDFFDAYGLSVRSDNWVIWEGSGKELWRYHRIKNLGQK